MLEKINVSDVCQKHGITPGMFYEWQKKLFEQGSVVLNGTVTTGKTSTRDTKKLAAAEAKIQQKNEVMAELMSEHVALKKTWPDLNGQWTAHDVRDQVIDFVRRWSEKTGLPISLFITWLGIGTSKFYSWQKRFGKVNEHNAWIPRDHWLEESEKQAILAFERDYPLEGYRRLAFMMLDADQAPGLMLHFRLNQYTCQ